MCVVVFDCGIGGNLGSIQTLGSASKIGVTMGLIVTLGTIMAPCARCSYCVTVNLTLARYPYLDI